MCITGLQVIVKGNSRRYQPPPPTNFTNEKTKVQILKNPPNGSLQRARARLSAQIVCVESSLLTLAGTEYRQGCSQRQWKLCCHVGSWWAPSPTASPFPPTSQNWPWEAGAGCTSFGGLRSSKKQGLPKDPGQSRPSPQAQNETCHVYVRATSFLLLSTWWGHPSPQGNCFHDNIPEQVKRTLLIVTGQYKQLIFAVVCILLKSKLLKLFVILGNDDKFQVYIRL